jgi:hypothetical protein
MQIEINPLQRGPKYCQSLYGAGTTRSLISSMANHQRLLSSRASREKSAGPGQFSGHASLRARGGRLMVGVTAHSVRMSEIDCQKQPRRR